MAEEVEYRTLGVDDIKFKYTEKPLGKLLECCNTAEFRNLATKYYNTWKDTKLQDRPFIWAVICAMNNNNAYNFFEGPPPVTFNSGFPCLFYNYDMCGKPAHAQQFHYCMLCREDHPLLDYDLGAKPDGECRIWAALVRDFTNLCTKLKSPPAEVMKLFRPEQESPQNPTIRVEKRKNNKKEKKKDKEPNEKAAPAATGTPAAVAEKEEPAKPKSDAHIFEDVPAAVVAKPAKPAFAQLVRQQPATVVESSQKSNEPLKPAHGWAAKLGGKAAVSTPALPGTESSPPSPAKTSQQPLSPSKQQRTEQEASVEASPTAAAKLRASASQDRLSKNQTPEVQAGTPTAPETPLAGSQNIEYRTLGVDDVKFKYANDLLSGLLVGCNTAEIRNLAAKYFGIWKDTRLDDRPFIWAVICAMNNSKQHNFFDGLPPVTFSSGFPCLFYNYDMCGKPAHAAIFHYCMLCREDHPLLDYDLAAKPEGECRIWAALVREFATLCAKLKSPPEEVIKLFRPDADSPRDPTIRVEKRAKKDKKEKKKEQQQQAAEKNQDPHAGSAAMGNSPLLGAESPLVLGPSVSSVQSQKSANANEDAMKEKPFDPWASRESSMNAAEDIIPSASAQESRGPSQVDVANMLAQLNQVTASTAIGGGGSRSAQTAGSGSAPLLNISKPAVSNGFIAGHPTAVEDVPSPVKQSRPVSSFQNAVVNPPGAQQQQRGPASAGTAANHPLRMTQGSSGISPQRSPVSGAQLPHYSQQPPSPGAGGAALLPPPSYQKAHPVAGGFTVQPGGHPTQNTSPPLHPQHNQLPPSAQQQDGADAFALSSRVLAASRSMVDPKEVAQIIKQLGTVQLNPKNEDFVALCAPHIVSIVFTNLDLLPAAAPLFLKDAPVAKAISVDFPAGEIFLKMICILGKLTQQGNALQLSNHMKNTLMDQVKENDVYAKSYFQSEYYREAYEAGKKFLDGRKSLNDSMYEVETQFKEIVTNKIYPNRQERMNALRALIASVKETYGTSSCVFDVLLLLVEADHQRKVMEAFSTEADVVSAQAPAGAGSGKRARIHLSQVYTDHFRGIFYTLKVDASSSIPFCDWNPPLFAGQMVQVVEKKKIFKFTIRSIMPYELVLRADTEISNMDLAIGGCVTINYLYNPWHFNAMIASLKYGVVQNYLHALRHQQIVTASTPNTQLIAPEEDLDEKEAEAVSRIIQRPRLLIIWGPPGTGKTHTLVAAINAICKRKMGRVLACASSNYAANLLAMKVKDLGNVSVTRIFSASVAPYDVLRSQFRDLLTISNPKFRNPEEDVTIETQFGRASHEDVLSHEVIVCTTAHTDWMRNLPNASDLFDFVFIDEAGQALEAEMLIPFSFCKPDTTLILAGDPLQLGPTILSDVAQQEGAGQSFLSKNMSLASTGAFDYVLLTKCYRCHPAILNLFNSSFYRNSLESAVATTAKRRKCVEYDLLPVPAYPVIFVNVPSEDKVNLDAINMARTPTSPLQHVNRNEVHVVVDACRDLVTRYGFSESEIVVLTPYREQQLAIRYQLVLHRLGKLDTMIVDQFQGQERLVVIISAVTGMRDARIVNSEFVLGFVGDRKRSNVALSRARGLLIIVGCAEQLAEADKETWKPIIGHLNRKGVIVAHNHFSSSLQHAQQVSRLINEDDWD